MPPYRWLLLVSSLYRCALCSILCGVTQHLVSEESGDILLSVEKVGVTEISWVRRNSLIAITKPHESVQVKARQFKNRLYNGTNGSLNITGLMKEDQGLFVANVRTAEEQECDENYNLTVYSKLSEQDIKIRHKVTPSDTCNVTLMCAVDKMDVSVVWSNPTTPIIIKSSTIQVGETYVNSSWTCTASQPISSVSRSVVPSDFCRNENKWEIILVAICIGFALLATIVLIYCLWKKQKYMCIRLKWKRKSRLTSTSDDLQQGDHVYWEIEDSKKSAYKRGDLLQCDNNPVEYCK